MVQKKKKKSSRINKVIRVLIWSDVALLTGLGFIIPIFAIYISDSIEGGNIEVVGFAAAVYWIVKSIIIIPFGKYLDRNHGEKDDLAFIIIGNLLSALAIFGYIFATMPWHIYLLQAIYAIGIGMNIPGFTAIFTRHVDKGREAYEWSAHSAALSIGTGIAGAVGGMIAYNFGFNTLFIGVGFFLIVSSLLPFLIGTDISIKNKKTIRTIKYKDSE